MENTLPSRTAVLNALLQADMTTQWRNRKSLIMTILAPVIILMSWKGSIRILGSAFALSNCITIGLIASGLMGYSNSLARDRERGVFERLRVAPVPTWSIMCSRLIIQMAMILLVTITVYVVGYYYDGALMSPQGYLLCFVMTIAGGAVYLGLGQAIAGYIKNPETVQSTSRLVFIAFILVGMLGDMGVLGQQIKEIVSWSPYGTVERILSAGLQPDHWNSQTSVALLVTLGYALLFSIFGIRLFKWK